MGTRVLEPHRDFPVRFGSLLAQSFGGPPRRILLLLGWEVGDDPAKMHSAAFAISAVLAVVTVCIYVICQLCCCDSAGRRRKRTLVEGPPALSAAGMPLDELWTVHNKRYDMSQFVASHPGGAAAIKLGQGRNCTELFESYHSLSNEKLVAAALERCYVEDTPAGARDFENEFNWHETPVWSALKARVREHFDKRSVGSLDTGHRADAWQWLQLICFIGASVVALRSFMRGESAGAIALPFCYWWGPSPCMHDGGHFSLCRRPWLNELFAHIGGAHMSLFSWQHQHTIGHHVHTNISGRDPDLYHFNLGADSGLPGFRTSMQDRTIPKSSNGTPREHWWRLGLRLRVPLTSFGPSIIWDAMSLMNGAFAGAFLGLVAYPIGLSDFEIAMHSIGRCIVIWLAIIHPITVCLVTASGWIYGAIAAVLFVLCPYAIHGCLFYMFSQVSHVQEECHPTPRAILDHADPSAYVHEHPFDKHSLQERRLREAVIAINQERQQQSQSQDSNPGLSDKWVQNQQAQIRLAGRAQQIRVAQVQAQAGAHAQVDTICNSGTAVAAASGTGCEKGAGPSAIHRRHKGKPDGTKTGDVSSSAGAIGPLLPQYQTGVGPAQEWAAHQIGHALDYACDSRLWLHLSNGLNLQVVHHLFPQVGWGHHIELSKIVAEVAKEHGLTYNVKRSFSEAMSSHLQYLAAINDSDQDGSIWVKRSFHVPLPQPTATNACKTMAAGTAATKVATEAGPGGSLLEALWLLDQLDTLPDGTAYVAPLPILT